MSVTEKDICDAIVKMGLSEGTICLHSSLKAFGHVEDGADAIIQGFQKQNCTIVVPTFFYDAMVSPPVERRIRQNGCEYSEKPEVLFENVTPYHPDNYMIAKEMGAIPAEVLKIKGSVRGNHPLNSFSAIGPQANTIIECQKPLDVYAPLQKMYNSSNAFIIFMGVDLRAATPIHFAEQLSGRRLFRGWAKISEGEVQEVQVGGCSEGFNNLENFVKDIEKNVKVGECLWRIFSFKEFIDKITQTIKENPMITHCGKSNCLRCNDALKGGPII